MQFFKRPVLLCYRLDCVAPYLMTKVTRGIALTHDPHGATVLNNLSKKRKKEEGKHHGQRLHMVKTFLTIYCHPSLFCFSL